MKTFWLTFAFLFEVDVAATCTTSVFIRLPDCVTNYVHPANATSTSNVTSLVDCLKYCTENAMCTAVNVCPVNGDPVGTYYCRVLDVDKVASCTSLELEPGCSYLQLDKKEKICLNGGSLDVVNDSCICPFGINGDNCEILFSDCTEAYASGLRGPKAWTTLLIQPVASPRPFTVRCYARYTTMELRKNTLNCPDMTMNLTWEEMKYSVGDPDRCSFWLGLEYLHQLTSQANYKLDLTLPEESNKRHAVYLNFNIGNESSGYVMTYAAYKQHPNPAGDGFAHDGVDSVRGKPFATIDRPDPSGCAESMGAAWWYGTSCPEINLHLRMSGVPASMHASWVDSGQFYTLASMTMHLIRIP